MKKLLGLTLIAFSFQVLAGTTVYTCDKIVSKKNIKEDARTVTIKTSVFSKKVKKIDGYKLRSFNPAMVKDDFYTSTLEKDLKRKFNKDERDYILAENFSKIEFRGNDARYYDSKFYNLEEPAILIDFDGVSDWCFFDACPKEAMHYYRCSKK